MLDLYSMELSKADWRRIVTNALGTLLYENKRHGLRHVFIEEAAEFAPQTVRDGMVYDQVERLARMGGNALLGYTLINQRAEEVNKAVLELCDNLFLHRQKGRNSLQALTKWLSIADVKEGKEITGGLPLMPQGECWAWLAGTERPVHVKVPVKNSFHPDRQALRGESALPAHAAVSVDQFVFMMKTSLAEAQAAPTVSERPRQALKEDRPRHHTSGLAIRREWSASRRQRLRPSDVPFPMPNNLRQAPAQRRSRPLCIRGMRKRSRAKI